MAKLSSPSQMPPVIQVNGNDSDTLVGSKPSDFTAMDRAILQQIAASAPTMEPPRELTKTAGDGATVVVSDKRVNALWSKAENRNSWVSVAGVGWKKLSTATDSSIMAMSILGAHAKQMNCRFDYREEADGMIHECTVW